MWCSSLEKKRYWKDNKYQKSNIQDIDVCILFLDKTWNSTGKAPAVLGRGPEVRMVMRNQPHTSAEAEEPRRRLHLITTVLGTTSESKGGSQEN